MPFGGRNSIFRKPLGTGKGSVNNKLFGKNSVFRKPLGTGGGSLNAALKSLGGSLEIDVAAELSNFTENLGRTLGDIDLGPLPDLSITVEGFDFRLDSLEVDIDKAGRELKANLDRELTHAREEIEKQGQDIKDKASKEVAAGMRKIRKLRKGLFKSLHKAIKKDYARELKKLKKNVDRELTKAKRDLDRVATKAKADIDRELSKAKQDIDRELTAAKVRLDLNATKAYQDVKRETDQAINKTGRALEAAGEPKNLLKTVIVYTASVYAGPLGSGFANALCDKLIFNKDMSDQDFLNSMAVGVASGYAAQYAGSGSFSSDYARNATTSIARNISQNASTAALAGEDYEFVDLCSNIATGAIAVDIEGGYVARLAESSLSAVTENAADKIVRNEEIDFEELSDLVYRSIAQSASDDLARKLADEYIVKHIPEEHRRLDKKLLNSLKDGLGLIFASADSASAMNLQERLAGLNELEQEEVVQYLQEMGNSLADEVANELFDKPYVELSVEELASEELLLALETRLERPENIFFDPDQAPDSVVAMLQEPTTGGRRPASVLSKMMIALGLLGTVMSVRDANEFHEKFKAAEDNEGKSFGEYCAENKLEATLLSVDLILTAAAIGTVIKSPKLLARTVQAADKLGLSSQDELLELAENLKRIADNDIGAVINVGRNSFKVENMSQFFETDFGKVLKSGSTSTNHRFKEQKIYKVTRNLRKKYGLSKGDLYYLDGKHHDHIEVFRSTDKLVKKVLNLDGTLNDAKTISALDQMRRVDF